MSVNPETVHDQIRKPKRKTKIDSYRRCQFYLFNSLS